MHISDIVTYVKQSTAETNPAVLSSILQTFEENLKLEVFDFGEYHYYEDQATVLPVDKEISEKLDKIFEKRSPIIVQGALHFHYNNSDRVDVTEFSCVGNALYQPGLLKAWCVSPVAYDAESTFLLTKLEENELWVILMAVDL